MTRLVWLTSVAVALVASVLLAEPSTVKTKDGQTYRGEVKERGDNLVINIHGVETVIPKSNVASVEAVGSYDAEYRARLAKLDPKDVAGRIALAREAFDHRRYDLARDTLEGALAIDPNSREATEMLELVQSQIRLERNKTDNPAGPTTPRPMPAGQAAIERRLLTPADVETIRRKELKNTDAGVRIRFDGDVKKRFADDQNTPFATFNSLPQVEQATQILDKGDDSMREKVRVLSDPQPLMEFRTQIQPLVLTNCAAGGCHGGPPGGGLILYKPADSDLVTYTNFYILQSYSKKAPGEPSGGGIFGGSQRRLIDRGHGEQSLLANYGLPANISEIDHPLVNGKPITPLFRNKDDDRYKMVVQWMNNSLTQIEPDYAIHYTSPIAASQPAASQPAQP